MVTKAGLEPATSPPSENKDALSPFELQRRHDLHDCLWRRRGAVQGYALAPLAAAVKRESEEDWGRN